MTTTINRRALVAGAVALPAISMPALAAADSELLAIGEKMKPLRPWAEAVGRAAP